MSDPIGSLTKTLDDVTKTITGTVGTNGTATITLEDVSVVAQWSRRHTIWKLRHGAPPTRLYRT